MIKDKSENGNKVLNVHKGLPVYLNVGLKETLSSTSPIDFSRIIYIHLAIRLIAML